MFSGIWVVVVGLVGAGVGNAVRERAAVAARQRAADARLGELGCGETEEQPVGSTAHFTGEELLANPPEVAYTGRTAAAGRMEGGAAEPGAYPRDEPVDERLIVHSLEHGFVTLYYGPQADKSDVEALQNFARDQIDSFGTLTSPHTPIRCLQKRTSPRCLGASANSAATSTSTFSSTSSSATTAAVVARRNRRSARRAVTTRYTQTAKDRSCSRSNRCRGHGVSSTATDLDPTRQ